MNVLITGGAGFIGTHLTRSLLKEGCSITIVDNFSQQIHGLNGALPNDIADSVELVRGDVRDQQVWRDVLPGKEVVVNLAAETGTGQSMYEVMRYEQVNLAGTAQLYEILAKSKSYDVKRIVAASSRAVYGEGAYRCENHGLVYPSSRTNKEKSAGLFDPVCPICIGACLSASTPESAPFQPSSFYGLTKQVQEQMTLLFGKVLNIPSVALRYQNVYGPGQSLKNPYTGILAIFSNLARQGADINVFEDGMESRDFVYIDDVVNATTAAVIKGTSYSVALNVGSDERTTVLDVANMVNAFYGNRSKVQVTGAFRDGDIRHGSADLTRLSEALCYSPRWKFSEGLKQFLLWAGESEPERGAYEYSLREMRQRGLLHNESDT